MRKFLATTALCLTMATGAHAAAHSEAFMTTSEATDVMGSEFIGKRIYTSEFEVEDVESLRVHGTTLKSGEVDREWNDIGEVHDILMSRDGKLKAVLVDVGGFLGIGERTVAVSMDQINFVPEAEGDGEYFLVINSNQEKLENAPEFDRATAEFDMQETDMTETDTNMAETATPRAPFPPQDFRVDGYEAIEISQMTAEDLDGARVYGIGDEDVGEISSLLLTEDGQIEAAVIDVGGFLGIGEKPVKVGFDQLSIQRSQDGGVVRVYIDASEESLEQLPGHDG